MILSRYLAAVWVLLFLSCSCFAQDAGYDPARSYPADSLKSDLQFLKKNLEATHPALYRYTAKPVFDSFFDSLDHLIDRQMNEQEFLGLISLLNQKIADGHTMFLPSAAATGYNNTKALYFPLSVFFTDGKLYVTENASRDAGIQPGEEILAINGKPIRAILSALMRRQVRDGHNLHYPLWILNHYFAPYYSFCYGQPESFWLELKNAGSKIYTKQIAALSKDSIRIFHRIRYPEKYPRTNGGRGIFLQENGSPGTAMLTIRSFDPDLIASLYKQDFDKTIDSLFSLLKKQQVQRLILDLRDNQGGDFEPGRKLLSYLLAKPSMFLLSGEESRMISPTENRFPGSLYVLINGGSFSNTVIVCSILEKEKRAVFIGEETGGNKYEISGNPVEIDLPRTGIQCYISTSSYLIRLDENKDRGVDPSFPAPSGIGDLIGGKDPAKELAGRMARPSSQ
jgi:Peptidase family S41